MGQGRARGIVAAVGLLVACAGVGERPEPGPPNIVLLIADDQGFGDFGFMGSPTVRTPHLDRLAAEGSVFPLGFTTASICRPALLSLLTGLHPLQFHARQRALEAPGAGSARYPEGAARQARQRLVRSLPTLPRLLASRGYASFQGGKYWEGHFSDAGFSHGVGSLVQGARVGRDGMAPVVRFVRDQRDRPFFLWFAPMLPHLPFDASPEERAPYVEAGVPEEAVGYYANATRFDARVGELLDFLDRMGLRENTLVVFLSDNGWQPRGYNAHGRFWDGPKGKNSLYELGFRTPIVFRWPGRIPAGQTRDGLVSLVDVVTTLIGYAGAALPAGLDGRDLRPAIEGRAAPGRDAVIAAMERVRPALPVDEMGKPSEMREGGALLRTRRWSYIQYDQRPHELYDMQNDPGQERDLAARHPELVAGFRARIDAWRREMSGL